MRRPAKILAGLIALAVLASCGTTKDKENGGTRFRVATKVAVSPGMEFLKFLSKEVAGDHGIAIDPVGIEDTVLSDTALVKGDIDANIQQHTAYLQAVNSARGWDLVDVSPLYMHIFAIYSSRHADLKTVPTGARVALNADPSNQANALSVLAEAGLITLRPIADGKLATLDDVASNPRGLVFIPMKTETIARALDDVDLALCQAEVFRMARISEEHRLYTQKIAPLTYMTHLVVRAADKDKPAYQRLIDTFNDPRARKWLQEHENNAYFVVHRP